MNIDNLQPQQLQKALRLCDIMSLQDIVVAATILHSYEWNVQKAIDEIVQTKQNQHKQEVENLKQQANHNKKEQEQQHAMTIIAQHAIQQQGHQIPIPDSFSYDPDDDDPYMLHDSAQLQPSVDYQDYQYQYPQTDKQMKIRMFDQSYISQLPLNKTTSQCLPNDTLQKDKLLAENYHKHRHLYQINLLKKSEQLYQKIFIKQSVQQSKNYQKNSQKINMNKKFIVYLHKVYKSKINFTFGTFLLNLIRSYLDDKYLVVFILHEDSTKNGQKVTQKILTQPQFANFVNNNCISYGMFDNSDDYETIQKYVPLKQLPAFALFKYNKKQKKQQFIASYVNFLNIKPFLSNYNQNCLQWLAKSIGIKLKKKQQIKKSLQHIEDQNKIEYQSISQILKQQNNEYEQIEKLYFMKRMQSKADKQKIKEKQHQITQLRKHYQTTPEPAFLSGTTIQIKFRMPVSGQSKLRVFQLDEKVQSMFNYVQAMFQNEFESPFCEFDLTQTFPILSLKDKKNQIIRQIFPESERENIIVKEV